MKIVENTCVKPQYNLALEEYLCGLTARGFGDFFMLWRNEPSIIVGRFQNTLAEINADFVGEAGIHVVRRNSGGGTVYHDLGNINYSFIAADIGAFNFSLFAGPILRALGQLGVKASLSGRNDITVAAGGGSAAKISGGAQYRHNGVILHHGTLLFDSDLDVLSHALKVSEDKFTGKGVRSVRSRVCNIRPMLTGVDDAEEFMRLIPAGMRRMEKFVPSEEDIREVRRLAREKYSSWEWNYGQSPPFTERRRRRFPWGTVEAMIDVRGGVVQACSFFGDYFGDGSPDPLIRRITGKPYTFRAISEALSGFDTSDIFFGSSAADMAELLSPDKETVRN